MTRAKEIQRRLKALLGEPSHVLEPKHRYLFALEWIDFAQQYCQAARIVSENIPDLAAPRLQLSGHALECALRGYMCAKGTRTPETHDLVHLVDQAVDCGLQLSEPHLVVVVNVAQHYFRSLVSDQRFKARYPSPTSVVVEAGEPIPAQAVIQRIVDALCDQASKLNDFLNRDSWHASALRD